MSVTNLFRAVVRTLRHINLVLSVSRNLDTLAILKLIIYFERLGLLDFLCEPRSIDDVSEFLVGVKRRDLLEDMFSALREAGVLLEEDGKFRINWKQVEKFRALRRNHPVIGIFDVLLKGVENVMYSVALDILRGAKFDFASPEVATVIYFQSQHPIYDIARRLALDLGGGKSLKGKVILDVGCGFGAEPTTILEYLDYDCHLICADFYPNILDECMSTLVSPPGSPVKQLKELNNVEFLLLDPSMELEWPIPDGSVDMVFSFDQFQWSHKPQEMMNEFARVLKRNGLLILVTSIKQKRGKSAIDVTTRLFGANKAYSKKEILTLLENAGFKQGRIYLSSFVVARKK